MTIGSTSSEEIVKQNDSDLKNEQIARDVRAKTSTITGLSAEIQIMKQQMEHQNEQLIKIQNLYMTLQNQFHQFQQQRARELAGLLGGASTVHTNEEVANYEANKKQETQAHEAPPITIGPTA